MKKLFSLGILLLFISCKKEVQTSNATPEALETEKLALLQKEVFDIPGLAVGVIKNGKVVYANAHGVQSINSNDPLTTKSVFHMASVSKPFVATAIIQLVEKGKIDLDKKLLDYLPYFKMADERYRDITIRHMLNHSSGIPDVDDYEWDKPQYDDGAAERYARSFELVTLDFTPGEKFSYSNSAFDILADVIAKVSGISFEDYIKQNIFNPIGMVNSTFYKPEVPENISTKPHVFDNDMQRIVRDVYPYNRRHAPSSTLHSNIEDMLLWAQVNLNKGVINGKRIYAEESYKLLTSPEIKLSENSSVCLSWFVSKMNSSKKYSHSGGDPGYSTYFAFLPKEKSAIVLMVNVSGFWSANSSNTILKNVIFNDSIQWKGPLSYKLKDYILKEGIEKTKEVYYQEKRKTPQTYIFKGNYIDELGYWLLERGHKEKALDLFKFNVELEPEYAGWPDSVADAYVEMDSVNLAIQWYKKALELKPSQDFSRKKLNDLLKK